MTDRSHWSLKRLAWAYGCAKKDSEEETELKAALLAAKERYSKDHLPAADLDVLGLPGSAESWDEEPEVREIHHGRIEEGRITVEDAGESVYDCVSRKEWPLYRWRGQARGIVVKGTARSIERAQSDARAALRLLGSYSFAAELTPAESFAQGYP